MGNEKPELLRVVGFSLFLGYARGRETNECARWHGVDSFSAPRW